MHVMDAFSVGDLFMPGCWEESECWSFPQIVLESQPGVILNTAFEPKIGNHSQGESSRSRDMDWGREEVDAGLTSLGQ